MKAVAAAVAAGEEVESCWCEEALLYLLLVIEDDSDLLHERFRADELHCDAVTSFDEMQTKTVAVAAAVVAAGVVARNCHCVVRRGHTSAHRLQNKTQC